MDFIDALLLFLLFIFGLILHYRYMVQTLTDNSYDLNIVLLASFQEELRQAEEAFDEEKHLQSIRDCLLQSKELSTEAFQKELKQYVYKMAEAERVAAAAPVSLVKESATYTEIAKEASTTPTTPSTLEKIEIPEATPKADDASGIEIQSLDSILTKEQLKPADEVEVCEASFHLVEPNLENQYLQQIYELIQVYREHISVEYLSVLYQALVDYDEAPETGSIVRGQNDAEAAEYLSSFDILSQVSLAEHVYNVTVNLSRELQKLPGVSHRYTSAYLLLAIYHDLGKLQKHRGSSEEYRILDHPVLASRILQHRFPEVPEKIIQALANHHKPTKAVNTQYHTALRNSDILARQTEIKSRSTLLPTIESKLTKDILVQQLINAYQRVVRMDDGARKPPMTIVHGYMLISNEKYYDICEYYLKRNGGLCREQVESNEQFQSAVLQMLINYQLITKEILEAKVTVSRRKAGRTRTFNMYEYLAIAIEALGLLESSLPEDLFGTQYRDIHFK